MKRRAALVFASLLAFPACGGSSGALNVDVETLDGRKVQLSEEIGGGATVVSLWAVWCQPCKRELPDLARLQRSHAVDVIALDIGDEAERVQTFLDDLGIEIRVLLDPDGRGLAAFGASSVPATFIVDADGRVVWEHLGAVGENDVAMALERLR